MRQFSLLASILLAIGPLQAQASPGRVILEKMHAAYAGKWYRSLTFVQKTKFYRAGAPDVERVETWWESLRYTPQNGVQLRMG